MKRRFPDPNRLPSWDELDSLKGAFFWIGFLVIHALACTYLN